jgi:hypothetical protein
MDEHGAFIDHLLLQHGEFSRTMLPERNPQLKREFGNLLAGLEPRRDNQLYIIIIIN